MEVYLRKFIELVLYQILRVHQIFLIFSADIITLSEPLTSSSKSKSEKMRIFICVNHLVMYYGNAWNRCYERKERKMYLLVGVLCLVIRISWKLFKPSIVRFRMTGHRTIISILLSSVSYQ